MRKSKNRYFYQIFVSPENDPWAIMLNVIWMEREFDAYKWPRWMCPSDYNRFSDRQILVKNRHFLIAPLHSTPPLRGFPTSRRNIATPFGTKKLEWLGYSRRWKKNRRYLYSFSRNSRTWQTDGHRVTAYTALMHMHHAVKTGPLRLVWANFTDSQHLLIIFGTDRPYSILNWLR